MRPTKRHGKKLRMGNCRRDIKRFSFPQRNKEVWNKLDPEIVQVKKKRERGDLIALNRMQEGLEKMDKEDSSA